MPSIQDRYDVAMLAYSRGEYPAAIVQLRELLTDDPAFFDARLALGMAYCRQGDYAAAIAEGHAAEKLRPQEQLVHTNLSVFYMKAGDKGLAEHHAQRARLAAWRDKSAPPGEELSLSQAKPAPVKLPGKFPERPWQRKTSPAAAPAPPGPPASAPEPPL